MEANKTLSWTTKISKQIEVTITRTREVQTKTAYVVPPLVGVKEVGHILGWGPLLRGSQKTGGADGYNVTLGKETVDSLYMFAAINAQAFARASATAVANKAIAAQYASMIKNGLCPELWPGLPKQSYMGR